MKKLLFFFLIISSFQSFAQCNVVATANGGTVDCYGDCDGNITYVYQNTGAPGSPYIVSLYNQTTSTWISTTTYVNEFGTIQFSNLCAGNYAINIQGSSCSQQTFATITQPNPIQVNVNAANAYQGNNGTATVVAGGGVQPYLYSIDGGTTNQSNGTFTGLAPGSYTATVTDNNGCTATDTFVINNIGNCNMVVTAQATQVSCSYNCNSTIQYAFTGSFLTGPFVIQLLNPNGQTIQTNTGNNTYIGSFMNVCPGTYTVQVTDANGCTGTYPITVIASTPPQITSVSTTVSAYGTATGSATINVSGGTAPYQYSMDNGTTWQSSNVFTGLAAGFYIVYVQDANGCQGIYCFMVNETPACNLDLTASPAPSGCYGSSSGAINFAYTNGTGPVTIVLQNPNNQTIQSQTNANGSGQGVFNTVAAGTYSVSVSDAAGCTDVYTVTVSGPSAPLYVTAQTTPATNGSSNGSITAVVSGGTASYQYSLNGTTWQSSNVFTGLAPGVYIIYVQDANGCTSVYTVQLTQITNCNQAITGNPIAVSCNGYNNGSVNWVYTSDGTGSPFTIQLMSGNNVIQSTTANNPSQSGTFSNLYSGTYTIQMTGANGCVSTYSFYVGQPNPIMVTSVNVTDATAGNSDGSAIVNVTGGTAPYTYSLNGGAGGTSNVLTGLSAGVQILSVTDANGCTTIYCFIVNETTGCQPLAITATQAQAITCAGACNGAIVWTYTSGGAPGAYILELQEGGNTISTQTYTQSAFQGTFTNLCEGDYTLVITDPAGCSASYNLTLAAPAPIMITASTTSATQGSSNGSITVNATGGTGTYQYGLNATNWQNSNVFTGLAAGPHVIYVQDANGCMNILTVLVGQSANCNLVVTAQPTMVSGCGSECNGEILYTYASTNGTAPFTVELQDQNGNTIVQTQTTPNASGTFTELCPGVYIVNVTDANGCSGIYTVQITGPTNMTIGVNSTDPTPGLSDGSFTLNITGGTPTFMYSIDNQVNWTANNTFTGLAAGVYIAHIQDAETCTQVTSVKLGQSTAEIDETELELLVYPNPSNGVIYLEGDIVKLVSVTQMDGAQVRLRTYSEGYRHIVDLSNEAPGVYFITVETQQGLQYRRVVKN